jgi:hypothetical protein
MRRLRQIVAIVRLDGAQRNLLGGTGLVVLAAVFNEALSPALLPLAVTLLGLAWRKPPRGP